MPHALPQLQRVDRSEPTKIIQAIIDDGCCIINNFTDKETVDAVNADTRPYLDADKPWKVRLQHGLIKPQDNFIFLIPCKLTL